MKVFPHLILLPFLLFPALRAETTVPLIQMNAELNQGVLLAEKRQSVVVKISLNAALPPQDTERAPVNLCLVMDRSGSMNGSKLDNAKKAALEALSRLNKDDTFSLVTYHSAVETLYPASQVTDHETVQALIRTIKAGGDTALFGGVSQGAAELRKLSNDRPKGMVHRMILLTDGLANIGPSSADELGRLGTSLMKEGISVTTVGVGNDYNEDLMGAVAEQSDGNTYFVENAQDLARVFKEEIGDVLNVVARDVRLQIECPKGVRPLRSIGREATIRGQTVELTFNQLYGGQEKFLLLEVEVPANDEGMEIPVLEARVRYHNVFTQQEDQLAASTNARFSQDKALISANVNSRVQLDYYGNQSALAKEEAIERWEAGDQEGAQQLLLSNSLILQEAAVTYQLPILEREAKNLAGKYQDLKKEGLTKYNRKTLLTEAQQEANQQRVQQTFETE